MKGKFQHSKRYFKQFITKVRQRRKFTISGFQVMKKQMDATNVELLNLKKRDNKKMSLPDPT